MSAGSSGSSPLPFPYCFILKVIRKPLLGAPDPAPSLFPYCFLLKVVRKSLIRHITGTASTLCFNLSLCAAYAPDLFSQVLFFAFFEMRFCSFPVILIGIPFGRFSWGYALRVCAAYIYICYLDDFHGGLC